MQLTSKEALKILQKEKITECKDQQVLLKWIREGKIKAKKTSKRSGYRIDKDDLMLFIEKSRFNKSDEISNASIFDGFDGLDSNNINEPLLVKKMTELRIEMGRLIAENNFLKNELKRIKSSK